MPDHDDDLPRTRTAGLGLHDVDPKPAARRGSANEVWPGNGRNGRVGDVVKCVERGAHRYGRVIGLLRTRGVEVRVGLNLERWTWRKRIYLVKPGEGAALDARPEGK